MKNHLPVAAFGFGLLLGATPASAGWFSSCIKAEINPKHPAKREIHMTQKAAALGTELDPEVEKVGMMPRGSAVATGSGNLESQGIRQIIHAASGSMTREGKSFDPTIRSIAQSVENAIALARQNGHKRVALPFIGGKIFIERVGASAQELADAIVEAALKNRGDLEIRFVTMSDDDTRLFQYALRRVHKQHPKQHLPIEAVQVTQGSITDFKVHGASAIVNAANMEVRFGGGVSGAIAKATGQAEKIDQEAQQAIRDFYASQRTP